MFNTTMEYEREMKHPKTIYFKTLYDNEKKIEK